MNIFDLLVQRGFYEQCTHENELKELLGKESVSFYIGFDPTADSLTAGHFLTVMAASHLQRAGHKPIILVGGGTGIVGDPSERSDMRRMMSKEEIEHNVSCFKNQLSKFLEFGEDGNKAVMVNNADWLCELKYIEFIRDYGIHFSVNRMLASEVYKSRLENGLTFFEFNYMLMQSYDFLELHRRYGCKLQIGGNDQWANIIAGVDLIRRVENAPSYGFAMSLLTTGEGVKMGKSQKGAVWLDADKTTPYEFFQYWRNVDDATVCKCLSLLTFMPMDEINEYKKLQGSELNKVKEILAYEVTGLVHGKDEADKALAAAKSLFGGGDLSGSVPETEIAQGELSDGINIVNLLSMSNLIPSKGEGRRLIEQGGIKINDKKVEEIAYTVTAADFIDGQLLIQKGKKQFHRITLK